MAQTGAEFIPRLMEPLARYFHIDFLNKTPAQVQQILTHYQQLLQGQISDRKLWQTLHLSHQLIGAHGTLAKK